MAKPVGILGALSIGIGGIVGGGFFATIGLAISGARGATFLAFLVGGVIALLTAHSYVALTRRYPGAGGTVSFVRRAFGAGLFASSVNTLLIVSYVAIMAVYARALASYSVSYFPAPDRNVWLHAIASAAIVIPALVNFAGSALVRRSGNLLVLGKLAILALFVVAGFLISPISWERLSPSEWAPLTTIVSSGIVAFLSYEGFELIANASGHIDDPARTLPIAFYGSVLTAIVLYALVIVVAIGHVPFAALRAAEDFALSAAAAGFMGPFGFGLMAVGAVLASASAITTDLFGAAKLPVMLAENSEAPRIFHAMFKGIPAVSLVTVGAGALAAVNFLSLHALSAATSAGFLIVFTMVNLAAVKLAGQTGSNHLIPILAASTCLLALGTMLFQFIEDPSKRSSAIAVVATVLFAVAVQTAYRATKPRAARAA